MCNLLYRKMGLALTLTSQAGVPAWRRWRKNKILFERSELILFRLQAISGSSRSRALSFYYFWVKPKVDKNYSQSKFLRSDYLVILHCLSRIFRVLRHTSSLSNRVIYPQVQTLLFLCLRRLVG